VDTIITTLIGGILIPAINLVTAPIPFLAASGLLLLGFAAAWLAFGIALVRTPLLVDDAWRRLRSLPLLVQGLVWLLLLPVVAGVCVWHTSWPQAARLAIVACLAGWNLVMFVPAS
jgi:hypothetical protein